MPKLVFSSEDHSYTFDGKRLPGVTEILSPLNDFSNVSPAVLAQAARRGSLVHEYTQLIDYGADPNELDIEPELVGYVQAWVNFCHDWQPEWELIEQPVHTDDYAGTLDRLGTIDGIRTLVDIKSTSSASRRQRVTWAAQLHGYNITFPREKRATRLWDVLLKKDGKYTVYDAKDSEERYGFMAKKIFVMCLNIHKAIYGG